MGSKVTDQVLPKTEQNQKILYEQIKVVLNAAYFILITYGITAAAFAVIMWHVVPHKLLLIWSGVFLAVLIIRAIIHYRYHDELKPENARYFGIYIIISLGITGLVWGIGVMLMFPGLELGYQFFIMFIIAGIGGSAFSSNTIFLPGLYAFFPALLLPLAIRMFFMDEALYMAMGSVTLVFMSSLYFFSKNLNGSLVETLKLRFENAELITQLRVQKDEAEKANNAKSKFLAAASHDLRQPLHALGLFTSILDETIRTPKVRDVVKQINASVDALQGLFNALLDISRLDAGTMKDEKINFDLQSLFKRLANDFDPLAKEKSLSIRWPDSSYVVYSDPLLLEQILRNYISNAIRYSEKGDIYIHCKEEGNAVDIQVVDGGIGIPEEEQENIFNEFHQLGNPERDRSKGLGLGLAIVRRTAKLLGHSINIASEKGQGSMFSILVKTGKPNEKSNKNIFINEYEVELDNIKSIIAVIDDEESIREGMTQLFETWGCEVIAASTQDELLIKLRLENKVPDGIIADYRLRENRTGIETIRSLYDEYNKDIPAVIVTGDIAVENLREVNNSGFQVLHKPVAPVKLRAFLRSIQLHQ